MLRYAESIARAQHLDTIINENNCRSFHAYFSRPEIFVNPDEHLARSDLQVGLNALSQSEDETPHNAQNLQEACRSDGGPIRAKSVRIFFRFEGT